MIQLLRGSRVSHPNEQDELQVGRLSTQTRHASILKKTKKNDFFVVQDLVMKEAVCS
jgi:hypothetical protein